MKWPTFINVSMQDNECPQSGGWSEVNEVILTVHIQPLFCWVKAPVVIVTTITFPALFVLIVASNWTWCWFKRYVANADNVPSTVTARKSRRVTFVSGLVSSGAGCACLALYADNSANCRSTKLCGDLKLSPAKC